jgi:hypothetical protein
MRKLVLAALGTALVACAAKGNTSFDDNGDGTSSSGGSSNGNGSSNGGGSSSGGLGTSSGNGSSSGGTTTITIYANTDDTLYSMDPQSHAVAVLGKFNGLGGGTNDTAITDCAVNAAGDVYVNSETVIYKATLPQSPGTVQITKVAKIAVQSGQRFYALAFSPVGVLGSGEVLVGGDGMGELWSIDPASGATKHLGNFGKDPGNTKNVLALSGDIVFYLDAKSQPTGLATIRSCASGTSNCDTASDYLAAIDMTALAQAYTSGTPATSLLAGIYGGGSGKTGAGTGAGELFGVGVWQGDVYAFKRNQTGASGSPPALLSIDTGSGKGSTLPGSFSFTNGWSGAGVTTTVTASVPPPPPK